jgi:hypothetical protein
LVNDSPVVQRTVVGLQHRRDRAQQMRLADAGRAADEQRVVCVRGQLGDGQRRGVGEPVAVADHELPERELWVGGRWVAAAGRSAHRPAGGIAAADRFATVAAGRLNYASTGRALLGVVLARRVQQLDARARAEHADGARVEQSPEAVANPAARLWRRVEQQARAVDFARTQRCQPDPVGELVDARRELALHACPYVLELGAHGSVDPLLSQKKTTNLFPEGPGGPGEARL